jgi:dipeptidase
MQRTNLGVNREVNTRVVVMDSLIDPSGRVTHTNTNVAATNKVWYLEAPTQGKYVAKKQPNNSQC